MFNPGLLRDPYPALHNAAHPSTCGSQPAFTADIQREHPFSKQQAVISKHIIQQSISNPIPSNIPQINPDDPSHRLVSSSTIPSSLPHLPLIKPMTKHQSLPKPFLSPLRMLPSRTHSPHKIASPPYSIIAIWPSPPPVTLCHCPSAVPRVL